MYIYLKKKNVSMTKLLDLGLILESYIKSQLSVYIRLCICVSVTFFWYRSILHKVNEVGKFVFLKCLSVHFQNVISLFICVYQLLVEQPFSFEIKQKSYVLWNNV